MKEKATNIDTQSGGFFAVLVFAALFFAWLAMGPCLDNGFTNWDDTWYIHNNPRIKSLSLESVKSIFASRDLKMYSPLTTLSYALNYHFAGLAPKAYHATALALHLANTALVMVLVRLLLPGVWAAFFCGLFFGIHPAHVESIAWAAERKDLLYSLFYLLSLCAYTLSLKGRKTYLAALGLFLCSLLSKSMAVTLPLALILIDYLKLEKVGRKEWLNKIPFFLAAGVFTSITLPPAELAAQWVPAGKRLALALYNTGFYVYTLAWPFDLSAMYVLPLGGEALMYAWAAGALGAAGLLLKYFRRDKAVMFGAAFYLAMLLPVLQFFPFGPVISADRYTYLASIGLFIAAYAAATGAWEGAGAFKRRTAVILVILAAVTFTVAARLRCAVWKDSVSLWKDTLRKQPSAGPALLGLCTAYLKDGLDAQGEACLAEAVRLYPGQADSFYNLGILAAKRGDLDAAGQYFEQALKLNDRHALALFSLGNIALIKKDAALAERLFLQAVERESGLAPALRGLGGLAASRHDKVKALEYYERALAADPSDARTRELAAGLRR